VNASISARTVLVWLRRCVPCVVVLAVLGGGAAFPMHDSAGPTRPHGVTEGWWARIQQDVRESEYKITWQERTKLQDLAAAWHAPNRAQGFRTYFASRGIRVIPRTEIEPSWEFSLSLLGYGRGSATGAVKAASLSSSGNRIEYARDRINEWYINDDRGLEQGFTVAVPPEQTGDDTPLYIALELGGILSPTFSADGQAIDFHTADGRPTLRYAELRAWDATGEQLLTHMEGFNRGGVRGVHLVIEDQLAVYPITVDPLLTNPAWTAVGDQDHTWLGASVDTAGDVNGDGFSDVIVAARYYDGGQVQEGRAFVYHGSASGLSLNADWTGESDQEFARLGWGLATAGDVNGDGYSDVIAGAPFYDQGQNDEGRTFVYHGSAAGLSLSPNWMAESNTADAWFGRAVGSAGDVNGDGYGDVIVGAAFCDGCSNVGEVFVYHGSATGLSSAPDWTVQDVQPGAQFGFSVATAGDVNGDGFGDVIVGARYYVNGQTDEGAAFVYHGSGSGLDTVPAWLAEGDQNEGNFGDAVSTAGDVNGDGYADVIIGARIYDGIETDEGGAFVFHGSATGLSSTADWTVLGGQKEAEFGFDVATAGDVNGDGYADVIVGALFYDAALTNEGRAFLYHGAPSGLQTIAAWTADGGQDGAELGYSLATAGDVNRDGYADAILGAATYDENGENKGRSRFIMERPRGRLQTPAGQPRAIRHSLDSARPSATPVTSMATATPT